MYAQGQVSGSLREKGKRRSKKGSFLYFTAFFSKVHWIYPLATVQTPWEKKSHGNEYACNCTYTPSSPATNGVRLRGELSH